MTRALVFDSGIGGLSVVSHMRRIIPDLSLTYVADDEFRPYGNKSEAALRARLPGLLRIMELTTQPDIIIIACNTASTTALPLIRAAVNAPVVGVVPAIKPAAEQSQARAIAVLGTPGTVRRSYVDRLIREFAGGCNVSLKGSTVLVEQAERKLSGQAINMDIIATEIAPLFAGKPIDAVVLACTHFPLLVDDLRAAAPYPVRWIDSGEAVARRCAALLNRIEARRSIAEDAALLIGPETGKARKAAFAGFGFDRVVGLMPDYAK